MLIGLLILRAIAVDRATKAQRLLPPAQIPGSKRDQPIRDRQQPSLWLLPKEIGQGIPAVPEAKSRPWQSRAQLSAIVPSWHLCRRVALWGSSQALPS